MFREEIVLAQISYLKLMWDHSDDQAHFVYMTNVIHNHLATAREGYTPLYLLMAKASYVKVAPELQVRHLDSFLLSHDLCL